MPTYHYRCSSCEQHIEVVQRMTDEPLSTCAACGGAMVKVLKPAGIVLKGSGFYRTDNRSSRRSTSTDTSTDSSTDTSSTSETSSSSGSDSSSSSSSSSEAKSATA